MQTNCFLSKNTTYEFLSRGNENGFKSTSIYADFTAIDYGCGGQQ